MSRRLTLRSTLLAACLFSSLLLIGCGQKGPLVQPQDDPAVQQQ
jgi:predicted small lipoprotein YifL